MARFLRDFELDRLSFWLGFLAAALFFWLLRVTRPWLIALTQSLHSRSRTAREGRTSALETQIRNAILRRAQSYHLAAPLFSLDEIVIPPRLLAPPPPVEPGVPSPPLDITETTLPHLPDWPEIASHYGAPTLTLAEALQEKINLVIMGRLGSGKSVALAYLASQIARQSSIPPYLNGLIPLLIHWADLYPLPAQQENTLEPLARATASIVPTLSTSQTSEFLEETISKGRLILLLDGLDELHPFFLQEIVFYLGQLLQHYPNLRLITTASFEHVDGLIALGLAPMTLAPWNATQQKEFLMRWGDLWAMFIQTDEGESVPPPLLNAWLSERVPTQTPLELTLKAWAAYAGDVSGPRLSQALEAYLTRITTNSPETLKTLETLAVQALLSRKSLLDHPQGQGRMADLVDNGLLYSNREAQLRFSHPIFLSFLAARALDANQLDSICNDLPWSIANQTVGFLAEQSQSPSPFVLSYIEGAKEPLLSEVWIASRWLHDAPEDAPWRLSLMRKLAGIFQDETKPPGLRARAMAALALSATPGVEVLFRKALEANEANTRWLAAIACGLIGDTKSVNDLRALFNDPMPVIMRAACLALVAIGAQAALEAVAEALLHGHEELRQAAAEALANHPDEGHPTLQEGATLEDLLVRRAVVFGLRRVRQEWAIEILRRLQLHDEQWVVKNAATQALEEMAQPEPRLPKPIPPLTELPWLIAFAGERGIGVAPGKPAQDLLLLALKEGNEEQRLGALEYLNRVPLEAALSTIYQVYQSAKGEIREAALNTLWLYESIGITTRPV